MSAHEPEYGEFIPEVLKPCGLITRLVFLYLRSVTEPVDRHHIISEVNISLSSFYRAEQEMRSLSVIQRYRDGQFITYEAREPFKRRLNRDFFLIIQLDNTRLVTRLAYLYLREYPSELHSRQDISNATGLHLSTAGIATRDLISRGFVDALYLGKKLYYRVLTDSI